MKKKSDVFALLVLFLLSAVIFIQFSKSAKKNQAEVQRLTPRHSFPTPTGTQGVTIDLFPTTLNLKIDQSATISVYLNTLINTPAQALDLVLSYDQNYLTVTSLTPGTIFSTYPINQVENNKILLSAIADPPTKAGEEAGFRGRGLLATVSFLAVRSGKTSINIEPKSIVAYRGVNVLKSNLTKATIVIY